MRTKNLTILYAEEAVEISAKVRQSGDELLVFLHGFGCAKECFDPIFDVDHLADFSMLTFDFPGHGASSRSASGSYSLEYYAKVANFLIAQIPARRISIVGHSMGGAVGLVAVQDAPWRRDLAFFVDVDGNLVSEDCGIVSRATAAQSQSEFLADGYPRFLHSLQSSGQTDQATWARWYAKADPVALHELARSLVEWSDSGKLLEQFKMLDHKCYLYGDRDSRNYLHGDLEAGIMRPVEDSGHFMMLDNPEGFYGMITEILAGTGVR